MGAAFIEIIPPPSLPLVVIDQFANRVIFETGLIPTPIGFFKQEQNASCMYNKLNRDHSLVNIIEQRR